MLYNIRKIRQENCMTQDELAKRLIFRVLLSLDWKVAKKWR